MALTLTKGGNLNLTKSEPGLRVIRAGLGWDVRTTDGADFDLDASAILVSESGKVRSEADFIFYNQPADADQSVVYQGDNRTGAGEGDDEQIVVDLSKVPADVDKVVVAVSIYEGEGEARNQSFGQVRNAFIRLVNDETGEEVVRYDLSEDYSAETALVFAELYRNGGDWKFRAVGQGYTAGLAGLARDFGVSF